MARKTTTTSNKTTKKVVKKKPVTKKSSVKTKMADKGSPSPFKSKLGHDPLSWINGEDAQELGISFDDIEARPQASADPLEDIVPQVSESVVEIPEENASNEESVAQGWGLFDDDDDIVPVSPVVHKELMSDDGSWGLFGDDEPAPAVAKEVVSDDGTWGLFGDEPQAEVQQEMVSDDGSWGLFGEDENTVADANNVGEGIAWGLFADEVATDDHVDSSANVLVLPTIFNVAEMEKMYHEFERMIAEGGDLVVDASETETIDACGLQLLYASRKELQNRGFKLVIKDASDKMSLLSGASFINQVLGIAG